MIQEIMRAFLLIFVAEMGDKTQILAMAFATRFPVRKVLFGIGIGSLLNHGLAVVLGSYLSQVVPVEAIQMIAGIAFVGFAVWTLKSDDDDEEEDETKMKFGPVATVSLAFFLGELGDKTQLTAITLAVDAVYPALILLGTVLGMIVTGGLGILIGKKMGDKIPELGIKLFAASIFMFFGLQKLYVTVPTEFHSPVYLVPFLTLLSLAVYFMVNRLLARHRLGIESKYIKTSRMLHGYYEHLEDDLETICLGLSHCKTCKGKTCVIGHAKVMLETAKEGRSNTVSNMSEYVIKPFAQENVLDSLVDAIWMIEQNDETERLNYVHAFRRQMEFILFKESIEVYDEFEAYIERIKSLDNELGEKIHKMYRMRRPVSERVINLGNRISNIYMVEIQEGYLLVDTGYEEHYESFRNALRDMKISLDEIKYVFVTHAHDDHIGFLNEILKETDSKVILHHEAVDRLKLGQNIFDGGCSGRLAHFICQVMKAFGKGEHRYKPVDSKERYLIVDERSKYEIETLLGAKIIELPGHTKDSIGLQLDDKILFCGDAAMNGFPSIGNIIIWIEDLMAYKKSWKTMIDLNVKKIYPSHGKPFETSVLKKNKNKLKSIKLYPLK